MSYFRKQKLVSVGNSLAVIIPRHVCRMLRLDRTTEVDLRLSDNQIVLRPITSATRVGQPDRFRLGRILTILVRTYAMTRADFARLSNDNTSIRRFCADVDIGGHVDTLTVARLEECLARRRELDLTHIEESWNETIDAILLQLPSPRPTVPVNAPNGGSGDANEAPSNASSEDDASSDASSEHNADASSEHTLRSETPAVREIPAARETAGVAPRVTLAIAS